MCNRELAFKKYLEMRSSIVIILSILCLTVNAWVGIIRNDPRSNHLGHCFTTSQKIGSMQKGEEKRLIGQCAIAKCKENGDIGLSGCAPVSALPPCYVEKGDLAKPYPACCYEIKCSEE